MIWFPASQESRKEQMGVRPAPYVYLSAERSKCQEICAWPRTRPGRHDDSDAIVKKLIASGLSFVKKLIASGSSFAVH
jgi:hypothetical protein